jgi:intracellular multiplication protein IcmC
MVDLGTALENLTFAFESLVNLVAAISYVMGLYFIFRGVGMYKIFATQSFASTQKGEVAGPLVFMVIGAILMYFPSTLDTSMQTLFGYGAKEMPLASDMSYAPAQAGEHWEEISTVLIKYMKLIGFIAFLRGWTILSKMGHSGAQPGSVGKGIVHIVAGVLLINIVDTITLLAQTFGFTD